MKKTIAGIAIGLTIGLSISTFAEGIWDKIDVLKNDVKVVVNGNEISSDNFLYNDTTYLPIRAVSEALNLNVEYDDITHTAMISERGLSMSNDKKNTEQATLIDNMIEEYNKTAEVKIDVHSKKFDDAGNAWYDYECLGRLLSNISLFPGYGDEKDSYYIKVVDANQNVLIDNIESKIIDDRICISAEYFIKAIIPLDK